MKDLRIGETKNVELIYMIYKSDIDMQISSMTCSECSGHVEKVLSACHGVRLVSVNLTTEKWILKLKMLEFPKCQKNNIPTAGT